ncbi:hypothetical protein SBC1_31320 [Caballeronia sp. SBC1]|uniref:hypothetical protein n=1 Tax=Caballeronia sp. SBC1 TaxID=2705548 RepID=UPI0014097263|nr:hypothetical protein [Caballeronia sp. SBC1]QIN63108.1 hypothetical protein SBC1_31320 [Caballeronia sp. SBC1]
MAVTFTQKTPEVKPAVPVVVEAIPAEKPKRVYKNTQPKAPLITLDEPGLIRNAHFQALLGGLSQAAFYQRRKKGAVPPPDGHDPRPYWKTSTVKSFLDGVK